MNAQDPVSLAEFCARNSLSQAEYKYHKFYQANCYDDAYKALQELPAKQHLLKHYLFARRHSRFDELADIASSLLRDISWLPAHPDALLAAREIVDAVSPVGSDLSEFHLQLLHRLSDWEAPCPAVLWQMMWRVGFPFIPDGGDIAKCAWRSLPDALRAKLEIGKLDIPQNVQKWGPVLNAQTANMLSGKKVYLKWTGDYFSVAGNSDSDQILNVRLLGDGYWRQSEHDPIQKSFLAAHKAATLHAAQRFDAICPFPGTQIFDVRQTGAGRSPTLSYHTIALSQQRYLNFKESALPDYFLFDPTGYSGWASLKALDELPSEIEEAEQFFEDLQDQYVRARRTKYQSDKASRNVPDGKFVLIALQVPDDTVASLAHMSSKRMLDIVLDFYRGSGVCVVVKPHPKDQSLNTAQYLEELAARNEHAMIVADGLFDLLHGAEAIITANSGVGFEALLYLKPVITTAQSDFRQVVRECDTEAKLRAALSDLDESPFGYASPDLIKRFLYIYLRQCCFKIDSFPESFDRVIEDMKRQD
ncbi:MAG: hypothetical protein Hens3KO_24950 [Henriciella sp.]